jgi:geranylgeranyl diphosphate synthase type I
MAVALRHVEDATQPFSAGTPSQVPLALRRLLPLLHEALRSTAPAPRTRVGAMSAYHLGWTDGHGAKAETESGKMLRPVLCLVACRGYGDPDSAVGVAAAVELLHAFSLVHDDIEDGDRQRRHRLTLWAQYGVPLALNAGDALFAHAHRALHDGLVELNRDRFSLAANIFSDACLQMIEGQHLDIAFEALPSVSLADYLVMARGKTGALIGASLALGALCGGAELPQVSLLLQAGIELGLAFQATDDALSFWGDPAETGKAIGNDLLSGKKSLPIVLAMEHGLTLARMRTLTLGDLLRQMEATGCRDGVQQFSLERAAEAQRQMGAAGLSPLGYRQLSSLVDFAVSRAH